MIRIGRVASILCVWGTRCVATAIVTIVLAGCNPSKVTLEPGAPSVSIDWGWGPTLPVVKSSYCTTAVGESVVTVGGTWWEQNEQGGLTKYWLREVYQLSPGDKQWRPLPEFPHPIAYALAVAADSTLYVIGGSRGQGDLNIVHEVYLMDLSHEEPVWQRGPDLPWPATRLRGGLVGDSIVVISDTSWGDRPRVLVLDTKQPEPVWRHISDLPLPDAAYYCGAVCANKLYVFGGGSNIPGGIQLHRNAYALDLNTSEWHRLESLPLPMRDMSASALDERYVIIAGGVERAGPSDRGFDGTVHDILTSRVFCYDTLLGTYQPMNPLPLAVVDPGIAVLPNAVVIVAGEDSVHKSRTDLVQIGQLR
jgi:Kelch motif protein